MRHIYLCDEMIKLRNKLTDMGIDWVDRSLVLTDEHLEHLAKIGIDSQYADTSMYRTAFTYNGINFSVINGYGSYGGYDPETGVNEGMLEMLNSKDGDVTGWLTAEDIIEFMHNN